MIRPPSVTVIGTDTGVGKTVVSSLLTAAFKKSGLRAVPFKPVVSGRSEINGKPGYADTEFLAGAAGIDEADVGLYRFPEPLSPHLAAERAGTMIETDRILARFRELRAANDAVIVEGVGGALVPLTIDETWLDFVARLGIPAVIVSRPNLGAINHTMLTVEACRTRGIRVAGLVFNRCRDKPDTAESTNPKQLTALTGLPVLGLIPELNVCVETLNMISGAPKDILDIRRLAESAGGAGGGFSGNPYREALRADAGHVWHPFSAMDEYLSEEPHPLMIVKGDGRFMEDGDGRRYIDGVSSLWVNVHGHRHPHLDGAVKRQLSKIAHTTLLGLANEPSSLLAAELAAITPDGLNKVFYSDNGSTAVEVALKVAFQYHKQTGRPEKRDFISFANAYHGDTIGAVSVGGHDLFHSIFKPLLFQTRLLPAAHCYRCPAGCPPADCGLACLDDFEAELSANADKTAAVIFEPKVQGAAGILVQPPGYMKRISDLCKAHDVLLIADEVATGFGRTGALFACDLEGIEPDIMAVAKGLTGGYLPLAATLFQDKIYDAFRGAYEELRTFFHGHTYTGNPLGSAAALANIELFRRTDILDRAADRAAELAILLNELAGHPNVGDIRQQGLMTGIELVADKASKEPFPVAKRVGRAVILKAREKGVIIRPLGDVVVLMPPLSISKDELATLVSATIGAIDDTLT